MFAGMNLNLIALRLQVPDATIRERAKTTGRESDRPQILEQRIKDYHREMDAISLYFPNAKIVDIDSDLPEAKAWTAIQTVLDGAGLKAVAK
jgi:adenylate kinase family enzyme